MSATGQPRARRQSPDDRRRELLDATVASLAQLGARGTTGREICRRAGVSHGLLRHYFQNPDNLLLETYEALCERFLRHVEDTIEAHRGSPREALSLYFATSFSEEWAAQEIIAAWFVFWQLVRSREDFAEVSARFNARLRGLVEMLLHGLSAPCAVPLEDAVAIISNLIDGLWIDYYLAPARAPTARCVALCEQVVALMFPD